MNWTRRRFLGMGSAVVGVAAAALVRPASALDAAAVVAGGRIPGKGRRIVLRNLHTAEEIETEYWHGAGYVPSSMEAISTVLRDFRTDERHAIDPALMDYLVDVAHRAGVDPVFSVISGYRSPQTNARLRERSAGVARHSMHIEGRAIDVRVAGVDCAALASRALDLTRGGVGYYRQSDFVHLDTGAFRTWKG